MRYGRAVLVLLGVALATFGAIALVMSNFPAGVLGMVVGLVAVVLGASDWHEFEAQFRAGASGS